MKLYQILLAAMISFFIAGCSLFPKTDETVAINMDLNRELDYQVFNVENGGSESFDLKLNLSEARDVFFVFTNPTMNQLNLPEVLDASKIKKSETASASNKMALQTGATNAGPEIIKGSPWVNQWNEYLGKNLLPLVPKSGISKSGGIVQPHFDTLEEPDQSLFDAEGNRLAATCRLIREADTTYGQKTLNIWVADNCWENGGNRAFNVTESMVEALADKFLNATSTDDDIYDWVTNLYGEEWSDYKNNSDPDKNYVYVIPESDEITIFLYDILNDNSTTKGVTGMFFSKDNFIKDYLYDNFKNDPDYNEANDASRFSNERIMFYIDAVLFATSENRNLWRPTDYWPQEIFSTLAHEFQHMINFNIKTLQYKTDYTETWLNELMSLCTEDILADKIGVKGPRGVDFDDPGQGSSDNYSGRLPLHIVFPEFPLFFWPPLPETNEEEIVTWAAYSNKYAFGAYLMRNTNPATFLNTLMNNPYTDYRAIEAAIPGFETIGRIYAKSGVANIISDLKTNLSDDQGYVFNTGDWNSQTFGASNITYRLGSINMYNYHYYNKEFRIDQKGPFYYTTSPVGSRDYNVFYPMANFYFKVGERLRGEITRQIKIQSGSLLTVVVKK